jgi:uncharacterized protein
VEALLQQLQGVVIVHDVLKRGSRRINASLSNLSRLRGSQWRYLILLGLWIYRFSCRVSLLYLVHNSQQSPLIVPSSSDLSVSWEEYHLLIEQLAVKIYQSDWHFNQIVCLAKGGLRVGDILARLYRLPLAILAVSSYGGTNNQERGTLAFAQSITMTTPHLGDRVLLVDDLADSGATLLASCRWLQDYFATSIVELKTAVIWYKACSQMVPDYYVDYLPSNPWIHQPFEVYEQMDLATLAKSIETRGAAE